MTTAKSETPLRDSEIEASVLAYLTRHPHAADTLQGITEWWLPQQRYVVARARIEAALERMVARGVLRQRRLPNHAALYALGHARHPPIH